MNAELKNNERTIVELGASGRVGNMVARQLLEKGMLQMKKQMIY